MKTPLKIVLCGLLALLSTLNFQLSTAFAQGTAFTYQGALNQSGAPANSTYDLTFTLFTAVSGGGTVGTSNVVNDLAVSNGLFTVTLDFGASAFIGAARWLEIAVRPGPSTGAYTNLMPRQPITSVPYAIFASSVNASTLIGQVTDANLSTTLSFARTFSSPGNQYSGNGANLTALNASQLTSGTVSDGRLSANVALRNSPNSFVGNQTVSSGGVIIQNVTGSGFVHGDGTRQLGTFVDSIQCSLGTTTPHPLGFFVGNGSDSMVLNTDGNLGVGTTTPARKLTVQASGYGIEHTGDSVRLGTYVQPGSAWFGTISPDPLFFFVNDGAPAITISTNNNTEFFGEVFCTALNITSDRNAKEQFKPVNARDVLAKVVGLPISEWQYKTQSTARHIGPMAQDFHEAFALGHDEKHITSVDADGVALAAIQGLNEKLEEQVRDRDTRIQELEKAVVELKQIVNKLAVQQNGGAR